MAKNQITSEQLGELIEYLRGTCCNTVDSAMDALFNLTEDVLTPAQLAEIDEAIFECDGCGWWCEHPAEDVEGEQLCSHCAEDREDA